MNKGGYESKTNNYIKRRSKMGQSEQKTFNFATSYYKETLYNIKKGENVDDSEGGGLAVICPGLPRTGTLSLKAALTYLLGGRCYHGFDNLFGSQEDVDFWLSVAKDTATDDDIREFFISRGCLAASDFPAALFYKRLLEVFPKAKVVLTTRSSESWQKSMRESLYKARINRTVFPWRISLFVIDWRFSRGLDELYQIMDKVWLEAVLGDVKQATIFCEAWKDDVRTNVPSDKLLVFQCAEGWSPLCRFLDKEEPDTAFPRLNDTAQFRQGHRRFRVVSCIVWAIIGATILTIYNYFFPFLW